MSWQAHEAVDSHSRHTKIHLFKLLHRLAGIADATGYIDMAPAQSTMSEWFNVSERTIRNWLNELIASSELTQTRIGSGPGNPSAYQINLPMPSGKVAENGAKVETKVEKVAEITDILSTLRQEIEEIKVEIKSLKLSTFSQKGGKGGNERWKRWKRKVESTSRGRVQTTRDQSDLQSSKDIKTPLPPMGDEREELVQVRFQEANEILEQFKELVGNYKPLSLDNKTDLEHFYKPAMRLADEFKGDTAAAWCAIKTEYERMIHDRLTPRRLSAVLPGVLATINRANSPPPVRVTSNGHLTRAEQGTLEVQQLLAEWSAV